MVRKDANMKKIRNWVGIMGIVSVLLLFETSLIHGWELKDVLSNFHPYIKVEEEFNNNIDLTARHPIDDYITRISPGFRFSTLPRSGGTGELQRTPAAEGKFGMDLDFNAGFNFYAKEHENNYTSLNGHLNAWYAFAPKLKFQVRDYLVRSDEVRESEYSPTAIEGQYLASRTRKRTPYFRNVFEPSVQYQFGRESSVALNYRNNIYEIQSRTSEDSMENFLNPKIIHWFDIRHGVSFEYGLTLGNFERSPDLVGHMVTGRYTYRFNPRTSIFGEYTHLWRNFDDPSLGEDPSFDYVVYRPSIGAEHAFTSTLLGRAQIGYFWQNPEKGSTTGGVFYNVSMTQQAQKTTYTLAFQGGYTEDYFTAENRGFTKYHRAIARVSHQLLQKMNVGLFGSYEWAKSPELSSEGKKPLDRIWAVGGNASYQIVRWLNVSLDLSHRENHSNISDGDYSEYRAILRLTATY